MSRRSKTPAGEVVITIPQEDEDLLAATIDFAANTLTGDLRDTFLDKLRHEQDKRPWHERSEAEQRQTVHDVETTMRHIVTRAVEIIAGHGRRTIKASVESVVFKDGIKAVLTASKFDVNRHNLADAAGRTVLIVVADPDEFTGEKAPVEVTPDQATLLGDAAMVVHSEGDSETPFS